MNRLTSYEVHKLIKRVLPWVSTYWERNEKEHQITIDEWQQSEQKLLKEEPQLFNALLSNIERRK